MRIKTILLISSFICSGLLSNEGKCNDLMTKEILESLRQKSRMVQRTVVDIDWKGSRVFVEGKFENKTKGKLLDNKDLHELKKKSFIPLHRNVVKIDPDEDIIYYEKREKWRQLTKDRWDKIKVKLKNGASKKPMPRASLANRQEFSIITWRA
ncbi:MAG: hypothetical protein K2P93_08125 [Alphaproteobacteria bacterium]|nr:hypothetical protein [Alphaproteobacteria bacterium]